MNWRTGIATRRSFLSQLLSGVALPIGLHAASASSASALAYCFEKHPSISVAVGRGGAACLQLLIEDHAIVQFPPMEVPKSAAKVWASDPVNRLGGMGVLNGVAGNFSGQRHTTAPQLFKPWSRVNRSKPAILDPGFIREGTRLPADDPSNWEVQVDGERMQVTTVFRKTVPIQGERISPLERAYDQRHLISLVLSGPLPDGATVEIAASGLDIPVVALEPALVSEALHVCHEGYPLVGPKKAYVGLWLGTDINGVAGSTDPFLSDETGWRLVDISSGEVEAEGLLELVKPVEEPHFDEMNFNGCSIYMADFSQVDRAGLYRIEVEGIGASVDFPVAEAPYAEALRLAGRLYFHQRSGCAISEEHGEWRSRPRNGHPEDGLKVWQTNVQLGRTSEGFMREPSSMRVLSQQPRETTNPNAWGGWHDAADFDRRIQHMDAIHDIATIVELFPSSRTLHLNIPESGKPFAHPAVEARKSPEDRGDQATVLPDLIHEALWGISLWRRTQGADGSIIGGVEYSMDGIQGSVSWNPVQETYAYGPEEWAAYNFVGAAAKLGLVIRDFCGDAVLGEALIEEATAAWDWAEAEYARGSSTDSKRAFDRVNRARTRSAASLYRASGHAGARAVFDAHNPFLPRSEEGRFETHPGHIPLAACDYVLAGDEGREIDPEIRDRVINWAVTRLTGAERIGRDYGLHNTAKYPWGLGWFRFGPGANWRAREAAMHWLFSDRNPEAIHDVVNEGMWFALGCNPSNVSFVQGLGKRDFADPLVIDTKGICNLQGQVSFGVAGGPFRSWEKKQLEGTFHPPQQDDWPRYAQIFECSNAILCSEFDIKAVAMEWLFACALAGELAQVTDAGE